MKRACLYLRVSTANKTKHGDASAFEQHPGVQGQKLRVLVNERRWSVTRVYSDRTSRGKERRPGLDALMKGSRSGEFDVVVVWSFGHFARSMKQLILALDEFHRLGIDFVSHQEALDTSTPMGSALLRIIAAMAELERTAMRLQARSGKPVGRPRADFDREKVVELRSQKWSWRQIALELGVGMGTVRREYLVQLTQLEAETRSKSTEKAMESKGGSKQLPVASK